ncbi:MAG: double-strand break repair protein AddB [Paracoccaceae bacterium]
MFSTTDQPRIFGCHPGVDFPQTLVDGLRQRLASTPPQYWARVEIFVNTRRMQRRVIDLFEQGPPILIPKISVIADIAHGWALADLPGAVTPLRRRLELSQLISKLLDKEPDLAPRSALYDLSDSLALLMAEMQDENVSPSTIAGLNVADRSGHWQRSQKFLQIVDHFFGASSTEPPDQEARQRQVIQALIAQWQQTPPSHPIIVAGSTGSRGSTALFMQAVAKQPQGALVLPGFDFSLPDHVWGILNSPSSNEDHPQYRLSRLISDAGENPQNVQPWQADLAPPSPARNQLISLALRPAPVTNQWLSDGPKLQHIDQATAHMALVEAASERQEALVIALALRRAADTGKTAALVTPDRMLTRRVKAALDRWRIEPDVSAGDPLSLSAPGRLLRHVSELFGAPLSAEALLILLKHPLVNSAPGNRGQHLIWTRELELKFRRNGPPFPMPNDILGWADKGPAPQNRMHWAHWIIGSVFGLADIANAPLVAHVQRTMQVVTALSSGPDPECTGVLWDGAAGEKTRAAMDDLAREAAFGGDLSPFDYANLLHSVLGQSDVRNPVLPHPNIMIWGTLEARVQGADLVILGGLNDGTWPEHAAPDPWLNRDMRLKAGLLLPERRIGLSAHDFQQAIAAHEVILTRSVRNAESQTVPSRWINRLTNLMDGMSADGKTALENIRHRGRHWLALADALDDRPAEKLAPRPSPKPPVASRPTSLSVTSITRLIRDPYAIYARYILNLRPLNPLRREPDAQLRGTVIHKVLELFIDQYPDGANTKTHRAAFMQITDQVLADMVPWPITRIQWRSKLDRVVDGFLASEAQRRLSGKPAGLEILAKHRFDTIAFQLTALADRIDRAPDGSYIIYDYKTGSIPSEKQLTYFDKQLLLEAVLAEQGAFKTLGPAPTVQVGHIGLGSPPKISLTQLDPGDVQEISRDFTTLISRYQSLDQGYTSRRAMVEVTYDGDYDHLARFGEWDETQPPLPVMVSK